MEYLSNAIDSRLPEGSAVFFRSFGRI